MVPEEDGIELPDKPQKNWNMKQNQHWLKIRGLATTGYAADLKACVAAYMSSDKVPDPLVESYCDVEDVQRLTVALSAMISRLMQKSATEASINKVEVCTKVSFLSSNILTILQTIWHTIQLRVSHLVSYLSGIALYPSHCGKVS